MLRCWSCRKATGIVGRPSRSDDCPFCHADLRCCRGCRFYDSTKSGECQEPRAEVPADRTKSNFCDYFVAAEIAAPEAPASKPVKMGSNSMENARQALDQLFAKK